MFIVMNLIRVAIERCNPRLIRVALDLNALECLVLNNKMISDLDFIYGFYKQGSVDLLIVLDFLITG